MTTEPLDDLDGPGDPVLEKAKQLRAAGVPLPEIERYVANARRQQGIPTIPTAQTDATRALPRDRPGASGDFEAVAPSVAANVLSAAQVVPGAEALEAMAGQAGSHLTGHPMTYRESLDALRSQTSAIPTPIKAAGQMLAGSAVLGALPGNPAVTGGALGAADQLFAADPDLSVGDRLKRAAIGGAAGYGIGKAVDMGVTGVRAAAAEPSTTVLRTLKRARADESGPLFDQAMRGGAAAGLGQGAPYRTPELQQFLANPEIASIADGLLGLREFAGKRADDPEVLDAIYKTLSDQAATAKRGLEAATPTRPNLGRFRQRDIRAAKDDALAAMDANGMDAYRPAVQAYAERSGEINALRKGQDAVRSGIARGVTPGKNLDRTTRQAFEDWIQTATPAERDAAAAGVLGGTKQAVKGKSLASLRALASAPPLLRATTTTPQAAIDYLVKAGLLGANATIPHR